MPKAETAHSAARARRKPLQEGRGRPPRAKKISITVDPGVLQEVQEVLRQSGQSLSAHISLALARDLRLRRLGEIVADYEKEHGVIDEAELAEIRRQWRD